MNDDEHHLLGLPVWVLSALANVVTILGALGVAFAAYQYFVAQEAARAKETLHMIEIWETRDYDEAFNALRDEVIAFWQTVPEEDLELAKTSSKAQSNLRKAMEHHVFSSANSQYNFDRMVYFFNRLGLCIEARLCSKHTARIFFRSPLPGS